VPKKSNTQVKYKSSGYVLKYISFHAFPVDGAVRAEWMQKIRRDDFNPTKNTRVCSRHFKQTDFSVTVGGLRRLKKGTVPVYFSWNGYELPAPRTSVSERRPRAESPAPESDSDSEMETEMAPDHDYCVVPQTGARANNLADENEALRRQITELQQQLEVNVKLLFNHLNENKHLIHSFVTFCQTYSKVYNNFELRDGHSARCCDKR
uniref:THAP-type domain-containing protein n=1 Tax=Sparus aurata TaxID=8175 RepID=A0A671UBM4_SPAAU